MLTHSLKRLLDLICERIDRDGVAPSYAEIAQGLGLRSKSGIQRLVVELEARGYVRRVPDRARSIEILRRPETTQDERAALHRFVGDWRTGVLSSNEAMIAIAEILQSTNEDSARAA